MITIRQATLLDILSLVKLAESYKDEAHGHDDFPFDVEHSMRNVAHTIMSEDGCLLMALCDNEPVGILWGIVHSMPWSEARLAFDTILYVSPAKRNTSIAFRLMRAWEAWAKDRGAKQVQISIASGIHEERSISFYKKLGYNYIGQQFRKEC